MCDMIIINMHACVLLLKGLHDTCVCHVSKEHWTMSIYVFYDKIIPEDYIGTKEIIKK